MDAGYQTSGPYAFAASTSPIEHEPHFPVLFWFVLVSRRIMNLHLVFISVLKSFFWYYFASSRFFFLNNFSVQCMWVVSMHMCVLRVHLVSSIILTHSFEARSLRQRGARLPVNKPQWLSPYIIVLGLQVFVAMFSIRPPRFSKLSEIAFSGFLLLPSPSLLPSFLFFLFIAGSL